MKTITYGIACAVLGKNGKLLLLKRSPEKKLFPKKWFVVGAYPLSATDDFRKITENEIISELGVKGKIIKEGRIFIKSVKDGVVKVKPFLAEISTDNILLNEEHTDYQWIDKEKLNDFNLVGGTKRMILDLLQDDN